MAKRVEMIFEHGGTGGRKGVLGIDEDSRLYWNGELVSLRQEVVLTTWVNISVVVGGFSALASAIVGALAYFMPR
jgi:hypothetical protein